MLKEIQSTLQQRGSGYEAHIVSRYREQLFQDQGKCIKNLLLERKHLITLHSKLHINIAIIAMWYKATACKNVSLTWSLASGRPEMQVKL